MPPLEPFLVFTRKFAELGLRYMVKLEFFREGGSGKHLRDIRRMLGCLGSEWDRRDLDRLIGEQGLEAEWSRIQSD